MAQIRWAPQAADDLEAIAEFIGLDSPHFASLFVLDILAAIEWLEEFPQLGMVVPEILNPAIRERILGSYRVKLDKVEILTIYHGARLFDLSKIKY